MQLDKTINVLGICIKRLTSFARHDAPYPDENVVGFAEPRSSVTGALARGDDADNPFAKIATALLRLIERWRNEAVRAGRPISRIALAYEAGRDGFWLARWLIAQGIEVHVIHSASVAVSRERKRAKTDRLDAAMLTRVFLGWLRGEREHCGMVAVPTMEEEDANPTRHNSKGLRAGESLAMHQFAVWRVSKGSKSASLQIEDNYPRFALDNRHSVGVAYLPTSAPCQKRTLDRI
jgi:hypothetical protein